MKSSLKKAKRIGKKPTKFKFTLLVHSLEITHTPAWTKPELAVQWSRNSRSAITQPSRGPDPVTAEKAKAVWEEILDMVVTLYKDDKKPDYEEKEYSLKIWEVKGDRLAKQIGTGHINLANFASNELPLKQTIELKSNSSKIEKLILRASISAQVTEATDDQMSEFDAMSERTEVSFHSDDGEALEENPEPTLAPSEPIVYDAKSFETQEILQSLQKLKKLSEVDVDKESSSSVKATFNNLRKEIDAEFYENEKRLRNLVAEYANIKVALADSEYEREKLKLENSKLAKKLASTKLTLIQQQQNMTKLEAKLAR